MRIPLRFSFLVFDTEIRQKVEEGVDLGEVVSAKMEAKLLPETGTEKIVITIEQKSQRAHNFRFLQSLINYETDKVTKSNLLRREK